jgi:hypothetical protein
MKIRFAELLIFLLGIAGAHAQKPAPKVRNVIVSCTCTDSVGKAYSRALRDIIAKSPRYAELSDTKENRKQALLLSIITLPIDDDSQGTSSEGAISIVFAFDAVFLNQYVQVCGINAAERCAQTTLDSVDSFMNN